MKKKLIALALTLALCLSTALPAFASDDDFVIEDGILWGYFGSDTTIVFPDGINTIGGYAFSVRDEWTSVTFPSSLITIEEYAFADCTGLTSLTLPSKLTTIGDYAFGNCANVTYVTIPASVTNIGEGAFTICNKLADVYYGGSESQWKTIQIGPENDSLLNANIHYNSTGNKNNPPSSTPGTFTDVPTTSPYKDAIAWAVARKITNGITATTFGPSNTCTVSHILTFLWRAAGQPGDSVTDWAKSVGINAGSMDAPCTRAMAVDYMWKAAGSPKSSKAASFSDVSASASYAQAVAWAVEKGITTGTSAKEFSPDKTCTRGQIVTFLYRASK